jgi:hypothetical protein
MKGILRALNAEQFFCSVFFNKSPCFKTEQAVSKPDNSILPFYNPPVLFPYNHLFFLTKISIQLTPFGIFIAVIKEIYDISDDLYKPEFLMNFSEDSG